MLSDRFCSKFVYCFIAFVRIFLRFARFCIEGRRQKAEGRREKEKGKRQRAEGRRKAEGGYSVVAVVIRPHPPSKGYRVYTSDRIWSKS
jgi:hypothetical protein